MAIDPVCGMEVDEATAPAKADYKGKTYLLLRAGLQAAIRARPREVPRQITGAETRVTVSLSPSLP